MVSPDLPIYVDHGDKLFERLNGKESLYSDELNWPKDPVFHFYQRPKNLNWLTHATEIINSGITAA